MTLQARLARLEGRLISSRKIVIVRPAVLGGGTAGSICALPGNRGWLLIVDDDDDGEIMDALTPAQRSRIGATDLVFTIGYEDNEEL